MISKFNNIALILSFFLILIGSALSIFGVSMLLQYASDSSFIIIDSLLTIVMAILCFSIAIPGLKRVHLNRDKSIRVDYFGLYRSTYRANQIVGVYERSYSNRAGDFKKLIFEINNKRNITLTSQFCSNYIEMKALAYSYYILPFD